MIVRTSDLGYSMDYYEVDTNATPEQLKEVNFSGLIQTHRSTSTEIKQLQEASKKMGYTFEYKIIAEDLKGLTDEVRDLKVDYEAHYGNY